MTRQSAARTTVPSPVPTIAGGFIRVEVAQLHRAWHACRQARGGSTDFRAWLAALEMRARRGPAGRAKAHARDRERRPVFGVPELARLCAIGERRAAAAVRNLGRLGLLEWDSAGRAIAAPTEAARPTEASHETPLDDSFLGRSGIVSLPRRVVRFLARGAKPAVIATTLGVLLRCVSRRRAGWTARGRVKASWIAEVFAVDARRVKAARGELAQLGWLRTDEGTDPQWAWNRWGRAFVVDLAWSDPTRPAQPAPVPVAGADCQPIPPQSGAKLSPPDLDPAPVPEKKNPDLGSAQPAGIDIRHQGDESVDTVATPQNKHTAEPGEKSVPPASEKASKTSHLSRIELEDLTQLDRTLALYAAAVRAGWSGGAEADRLRFMAAAVHARGIGATNPAGLFRAIVQGKRWHLITQAEEDQARARLRHHDQAGATPSSPATRRPVHSQRPDEVAISPLGAVLDRLSPRFAGFGAVSEHLASWGASSGRVAS